MKKKAYLMVLALCAALAITACGTSTDQKDDKKPAAEAQDTTDKEDSGSADSKESEETDSNKDSEEAASGDTRLVSVDDVSKYITIGQYKGLTLDNSVEAVTDDMVDGRVQEELQNKEEEVTEDSQKFAGVNFVITGSVEHFANRAEVKAEIEKRGGKVTGSVTSKTNYLINNDVNSTSSKNKKARDLGVPIISEKDFLEML